jgi:hypothetical protein
MMLITKPCVVSVLCVVCCDAVVVVVVVLMDASFGARAAAAGEPSLNRFC